MRLKSFIFLLLPLIIIVNSCKSDKEQITGKWDLLIFENSSGSQIIENSKNNFVQFDNDGFFRSSQYNGMFRGDWEIDSKNYTIKLSGFRENSYLMGKYELRGNKLVIKAKLIRYGEEDKSDGITYIELSN